MGAVKSATLLMICGTVVGNDGDNRKGATSALLTDGRTV